MENQNIIYAGRGALNRLGVSETLYVDINAFLYSRRGERFYAIPFIPRDLKGVIKKRVSELEKEMRLRMLACM